MVRALLFVPIELRTKQIIQIALQKNGLAIEHLIDEECQDPELWKLAIRQNGKALRSMPQEYITQEICDLAVATTPASIAHVPAMFQTAKLQGIALAAGCVHLIPHECLP